MTLGFRPLGSNRWRLATHIPRLTRLTSVGGVAISMRDAAILGAAFMMAASLSAKSDARMPIPTIFAPGVISGGAIDGAPTFSPDGKTLFFERTNSRWTAILTSRRNRGAWSTPILAPFSGATSDQQPCFSPDGIFLIFVSSRSSAGGKPTSHLYRVDRTSSGWSEPVELSPRVNISSRVFKPSVAANGDLYFMSDVGAGGAPVWRLFRARSGSNGFERSEQLTFTQDGDVDPFIAPDQSYLIFSSNSRAGSNDTHEHLYLVRSEEGGWGRVERIRYDGDDWGADDGEAQVSPDGSTLYFTSTRIIPMPKVRTRQTAIEALRRMNSWDNSNSNVWSLPLSRYLDSASVSRAAGGRSASKVRPGELRLVRKT